MINENIAEVVSHFFDEYGNTEGESVCSIGRWHGHLISVEGPKCKTNADGIHDLYEWDYYGHRTYELTCLYRGCSIWLPYGENYEQCGVAYARVPDDFKYDTDVSEKHAVPFDELMIEGYTP